MVVLNLDKGGRLVGDPEITTRGFVYLRDSDQLVEQMRATINDTLIQLRQSHNGKRRDRLQESLGRMFYNETRRRPMIFTVVNDV